MTWLFAAFSIVWIAIFLYVYGIDRKQKALADEVATLSEKLSQRGG